MFRLVSVIIGDYITSKIILFEMIKGIIVKLFFEIEGKERQFEKTAYGNLNHP